MVVHVGRVVVYMPSKEDCIGSTCGAMSVRGGFKQASPHHQTESSRGPPKVDPLQLEAYFPKFCKFTFLTFIRSQFAEPEVCKMLKI
eukprot:1145112-Pelagomonas_calceolata.AAC.14